MGKYSTGAKLENDVKDILIYDGWEAIRAAGSHGIVDVMAVKHGVIWFIQCRKSGYLSPKEHDELVIKAKEHKAVPILVYKTKPHLTMKGSIIFEELKPRNPDFHYEIVDGRFTKVDG